MFTRAWRWIGRHLFLSYIFKTVLKSLHKKYAFWIIEDIWSKTAFSYLCASYSNLFQSEGHSYSNTDAELVYGTGAYWQQICSKVIIQESL